MRLSENGRVSLRSFPRRFQPGLVDAVREDGTWSLARKGEFDIVQILYENGGVELQVMWSANHQDFDLVKWVIEAGKGEASFKRIR